MADETKTPEQLQTEIAADERALANIPRQPVEHWAIAKGHAVSMRVVDPAGRKPATHQKQPDWRFAAARALHQWPDGHLLSEAEYDAALAKTLAIPMLQAAPKRPAGPVALHVVR